MPSIHAVAGPLAGLVSAAAFVPYLLAVARRTIRPNLATWTIWTVIGAVLCASYWASGARASIWVAASYFAGPLVTALFALRYGDRGWTRFDRVCLGIAAASIALWAVTGNPVIALVCNVFADFLGALPTLRKSWRDPGSEDRLSWGLFLAGNAINLVAVDRWTPASAFYPLYLFVLTFAMNALLWRPRRVSIPAL